jgi:hypothetical protein
MSSHHQTCQQYIGRWMGSWYVEDARVEQSHR